MASFSVPEPEVTGRISAPSNFMRNTFGFWRPYRGAHENRAGQAKRAAAVATATPCCPAPVSAMMRVLPMRRASKFVPDNYLSCAIRCGSPHVQINLCTAKMLGQPLGEISGLGRPT